MSIADEHIPTWKIHLIVTLCVLLCRIIHCCLHCLH